jgi:hypothetical protein
MMMMKGNPIKWLDVGYKVPNVDVMMGRVRIMRQRTAVQYSTMMLQYVRTYKGVIAMQHLIHLELHGWRLGILKCRKTCHGMILLELKRQLR